MNIFQKTLMQIKINYKEITILRKERIESVIKNVLTCSKKELKLDRKNFEVSILITSRKYMTKLNSKYRNINKETNVLSFPQNIAHGKYENKTQLLGDIVICIGKIKKEAKIYSRTFEDHLSHIVLHGFLHLLGYNHEDKSDAIIMEKKEKKILSKFSISDPYLIKN